MKDSEALAKIERTLRNWIGSGPMPLDVICKTAGTNYNTTRGVLGRLVKRKVVQHVGKGLYQITRTAA